MLTEYPAGLSYVADISGHHHGDADGQAEGDGGAKDVEVRGEETSATFGALPARYQHHHGHIFFAILEAFSPGWHHHTHICHTWGTLC
jgi:hypothetical protein